MRRPIRPIVVALVACATIAMATGCLVVDETPTTVLSGSRAYDVNDGGLIVGSRWLIGPPVSLVDHAFAHDASTGTTSSLGSLGGEASAALGVNEAGVVVGWGTLASGQVRAFRATVGSGMASLGTLAPVATTPRSSADDVNEAGVVVGSSNLETGATDATHAFAWDPGTGVMVDLGTLGGTDSAATAVDDAGIVVGWSDVAGDTATHAFAYDLANGVMTDLGAMGGTEAQATDINHHGQVVGWATTGVDSSSGFDLPVQQPFVHDVASGVTTLLAIPLGFSTARAAGINDDGVVVGSATRYEVVCSHCWMTTQARAWELGTTGGYEVASPDATASAVNGDGLAVGTTIDHPDAFSAIPNAYRSQITRTPG